MKDLLIKALDYAYTRLEKATPSTKKNTKEINIEEVNPSELLDFMVKNDVPKDAYFDTDWDECDTCRPYPTLCYYIDVETTEKEKLRWKRKHFTSYAFRRVFDALTNAGYKRVRYNSGLLKEFDNTTVYDMYIEKDFDRLVKYYSLAFEKQS